MAPPKSRLLTSPNPPSGDPGAHLFETERLIVRRYVVADAPGLSAAANHIEIGQNLKDGLPYPYTVEDAESYLRSKDGNVDSRYPTRMGVWVKPNTQDNPSSEPWLIGAMGMDPHDDVNYRTWDIGYWFTPPAWGKGYGSEAVRGYTRYMFETWPALNRLEASIYSRNKASAAVLKKAGFVEEGIRRGAAEKNGEILDETLLGLLRSDLEQANGQ